MGEKTSGITPALRFPEFRDAPPWQVKRLGEVASVFSGGTPSRARKDFYEGSIPFIGSGDISASRVEQHITEQALKQSSAKIVSQGDLLFALYGATSGKVAISRISGAINQAVLCIRSDENIHFLYFWLQYSKSYLISKFLQGGQGNLSGKIVKSLRIPLPSLPEQRQIAGCLSSLDDLIEAREGQVAALKLHKRGLMQRLFPAPGETTPALRFPEFRDAPPWQVKRLGE
ncbi:MAG: restriction endonuclease subunit S, partial [Hyphomonadaceae bacterium]|nr:restriction endonuclease subunit S [Hyphomonadaceae bacterium]